MSATYWERDGSLVILHTGIFATDKEVSDAEYGRHAAVVVDSRLGKPALPVDKIAALCRSYGLPTRYDAAHFAVFPPAVVKPCIAASTMEGALVLDPFAGAA